MTRQQARDTLHRLSAGLDVNDSGTRRLLERASTHDAAEVLRDFLVEVGARVILEEMPHPCAQESHVVRDAR